MPDLDRAVKAMREAVIKHRRERHNTEDLEPFFDCLACGFLEARLRRFERLATQERGEA